MVSQGRMDHSNIEKDLGSVCILLKHLQRLVKVRGRSLVIILLEHLERLVVILERLHPSFDFLYGTRNISLHFMTATMEKPPIPPPASTTTTKSCPSPVSKT